MTETDPNGPADTRMMGVVLDALRRDLARMRAVLAAEPPPDPRRRVALADHATWIMRFLHQHHRSEDEGLYPPVRARNPGAGVLLDRMDADHQAVVPAIAQVETAAAAYRSGDDAGERGRLLTALDELETVLLPHLRVEEDEMMPVVSATLTDAEVRSLEQEHNIKGTPFTELGREGHWLLDDLTPERQELVTRVVPAVPRFILLHGFARGYRRRSALLWGPSASPSPPPRRVQTSGHVEAVVDAPPAAVWEVVRDVTRTGEWSHECHTVTWIDGATEAVPGARFRGRNKAGVFRWGRICEIVSAEPWELTFRTVPTLTTPDTTTWTIRLSPTDGGGTRIEQIFDGHGPKAMIRIYGLFIASHRDRNDALVADLHRIGAVAARAPDVSPGQRSR